MILLCDIVLHSTICESLPLNIPALSIFRKSSNLHHFFAVSPLSKKRNYHILDPTSELPKRVKPMALYYTCQRDAKSRQIRCFACIQNLQGLLKGEWQ